MSAILRNHQQILYWPSSPYIPCGWLGKSQSPCWTLLYFYSVTAACIQELAQKSNCLFLNTVDIAVDVAITVGVGGDIAIDVDIAVGVDCGECDDDVMLV